MMKTLLSRLAAIFITAICLPAHAQLMLFPTRVIFENSQRVAQLELVNDSTEPATYRIEIVNRRMTEDGQFVDIEHAEPGELFADKMVRYSPRQVTLQPGSSQTIRFSLRRPADLATGEYRSHLAFRKVAAATGATSVEDAAKLSADGRIATTLTALIGASVPVIVRQGETAFTITLSGLALTKSAQDQSALVTANIERTGNRSSYGDLILLFTPNGGTSKEIANVGGVAVYVPNPARKIKIAPKPDIDLRHGNLRLEYRERKDAGGKLLAETAIDLP